MSEISIIKLMDGSTIVGKVSEGGDLIEIEHPIELLSTTRSLDGMLGEQISLRPWVAIAAEHIFVIERYNVITMSTLQESFVHGYEKMVQQIYFEQPKWSGDLMEELSQDDDLDIDTLTEFADAVIKKQIH